MVNQKERTGRKGGDMALNQKLSTHFRQWMYYRQNVENLSNVTLASIYIHTWVRYIYVLKRETMNVWAIRVQISPKLATVYDVLTS